MSRYTGTCFFVRSTFSAMSSSSNSEFEGYLEDYSVVDNAVVGNTC